MNSGGELKNLGRILAIVAGLSVGAIMFGSQAVAGEYTIKDCWQQDPAGHSSDAIYVETPNTPGFAPSGQCPLASRSAYAVGQTNPGDKASLVYEAPQGTEFLGAFFWYGQTPLNGVTSRHEMSNAGGADAVEVPGLAQGGLWSMTSWFYPPDNLGRTRLSATLECERTVNPCGSGAIAAFQTVSLKMRDSMAPTAHFLGGTLFDPGTVSGVRTAFVGGIDNGSGVQFLSLNVNDVLTYAYGSTCDRAGLRPCPRDPTTTFNVDTGGANFVNGMNKITLCVQDYATTGTRNATCANRYINVAK